MTDSEFLADFGVGLDPQENGLRYLSIKIDLKFFSVHGVTPQHKDQYLVY
jgi:hypothetical protein